MDTRSLDYGSYSLSTRQSYVDLFSGLEIDIKKGTVHGC